MDDADAAWFDEEISDCTFADQRLKGQVRKLLA